MLYKKTIIFLGNYRVEQLSIQHELAPHRQMWANFVRLTILTVAASAVTFALMALFLL